MSTLDDIRNRGYWRVSIRPEPYVAHRIDSLARLAEIADEAQVRLRGWDYPHTAQVGSVRGQDWVGSEDVFHHHLDAWRVYQSGQFLHYRGMGDDWRDKSGLWPAPPGWRIGAGMGWGDAVWQYVEIYEYAARLALSDAGAEQMHLRVELANIKNRALINDARGFLEEHHVSRIGTYEHNESLSRAQLIAQPRDLAVTAVRHLFERFDWDTTEEILRGVIERS